MPQRIYKDPFRGGDNIIVMCDCYEPPRLLPDGSLTEMKVPPSTFSDISCQNPLYFFAKATKQPRDCAPHDRWKDVLYSYNVLIFPFPRWQGM